MPRFLIPAVIVLVGLTLYALFEVLLTNKYQVRSMPKIVWVLVVLFVPLVGPLLWLFLGRAQGGGASRGGRSVPPRPSAPDDDEAFLRQLRTQRRQQERESELDQRAAELEKRERRLRETGAGPAPGGSGATGPGGTASGSSAGTAAGGSDSAAANDPSDPRDQPREQSSGVRGAGEFGGDGRRGDGTEDGDGEVGDGEDDDRGPDPDAPARR